MAHSELVQTALEIGDDLVRYDPLGDESALECSHLLLELEHAVRDVVLAERVGTLPEGTGRALCEALELALCGVGERCPTLAQFAEDSWLTREDYDLECWGWLDVLAEGAPSRRKLCGIVRRAARIDDLLHRLQGSDRILTIAQ